MEIRLSEEQREALRQARIRLSLLYTLPDICESLMVDILDYQKKASFEMFRHKQKVYWKGFFKNARSLREEMRGAPNNQEKDFASICDAMEQLILNVVDRCGDNDYLLMQRFLDYIKSFPSKRHLEIK